VQRAKRLLDTTDLPMSQIALNAGFGSLRRFNTAFSEVYGRPPTEIRRKRSP
jgi:AraC family transcriptional regulator, regulatory protein of adaptative response / methylated-DNA-[protein]-cysteine methyltransferase